ncbi:XRE family transcriptional regulator [Niallia circulans]|jgi:transcriptional regulator with XRE-family HTH domain|uniref:Cro/Cl family transcriptional regulator n=1 Tax=Niallia circulans TaxID=1397 RepID=A0A0J1I9N4_NIACI|nr:XRE family transcriptional regulator [Niallia circulans]KLV22679.1 Cro/Cl family transcriptional regulator [Niallia circulans]MCM2983144.1 XRE family transcriptional regulator [Niallia circulans]MDR4318305.1 helix-turn-helix domain-containing protein [Niallia circulans]MED3840459.1 XRE family transcriptional regulator [Niallia circulans]MED4243206.1 XRE family transcriptional regulator [Niallia circulans]
MEIGKKIKNLRLKKGLTQEELGERTDLSKGYISQLERDLSSPSIETFFDILEVLGCSPKEFFDDEERKQKVVYTEEDITDFLDEEKGYRIQWLVPESNEKEMEPIRLFFSKNGEFKKFEPSLSETFAYVVEGEILLKLGRQEYRAKKGESIYYHATEEHQLINLADDVTELILVVTDSYL